MAKETITTRAGPEPARRVRPLSSFTLVEQRAILALIEAADSPPAPLPPPQPPKSE